MYMKEYFRKEIPQGYRIFEKNCHLTGINFRKRNVEKVMKKGAKITLKLVPEPDNPKNKAALQIRGLRKGVFGIIDKPLGYVPANIASHITNTKLARKIKIRPKRLSIGQNDCIEFVFDLLGPRDKYEYYKTH